MQYRLAADDMAGDAVDDVADDVAGATDDVADGAVKGAAGATDDVADDDSLPTAIIEETDEEFTQRPDKRISLNKQRLGSVESSGQVRLYRTVLRSRHRRRDPRRTNAARDVYDRRRWRIKGLIRSGSNLGYRELL